VLLNLWSSIRAFRGEAKETTWIYRVTFNTALAWRRGARRRREGHERFVKYGELPQSQPSPVDSPPEQEIVERLYAAIQQLPKVDASLALMHLDGLSYQEMAEVVGISENYIGVKLNRIRKQLAEQLKGTNNEL
jgi:RNA polymerase sigma-70 factor (ECF subfamily)